MNIFLDDRSFEYDVYSLLRAFYPGGEMTVVDDAADDFCGYRVHADATGIAISYEESGCVVDSESCTYAEEERPRQKSLLKRVLYALCERITGHGLVWGTLTGIRPTKIPMKLLCEGKSDGEIADYMKREYLVSDAKIDLSVSIAHLENQILSPLAKPGSYSLYIGIPFCPTRCLYCSFTSYPIATYKKIVPTYLDALKREMEYTLSVYEGRMPDTIYFGGGTPTALSAEDLEILLTYVDTYFDVSKLHEFTVEAGRPDSITPEKLAILKSHGVTRISVNPQTMNEETLRLIGRRHTVDDFTRAYQMAREAGFDNINMDTIIGLPNETTEDVYHTLTMLRDMQPDSLTVHSMAIKRAAGMHEFLESHPEISVNDTSEMMRIALEITKEAGMQPYYLYRQKNMAGNLENVGFAKDGKYGLYNILIMEEVQDIAALGAGTISKRVFEGNRIERCDSPKDIALYIDRVMSGNMKKKEFYEMI